MASLVIREAAAALRRTPIMSVLAAIVIAVSLAICGIFALLTERAKDMLDDFRKDLVIEAFFDPQISSEAAAQATDEKVKVIPGISSLQLVSKETALREYVRNSGEDVEKVLGYNPLPASVRLTFSDLTSSRARVLRSELLAVVGMKDVLYDERSLIALENRSQTLYLLALTIGGVLLLVSLTIVTSTIRLAIEARREAISAMQLLGARRSTIILPYLLEGGLAGFAGGIIAGGLILIFHFFVIPKIAPELMTNISLREDYSILFGSSAAVGIVIGMFGSLAAIWRSSKL